MEPCVGLSRACTAKLIRIRCDDRDMTSVFKVQLGGGHILHPARDTNLDYTVQSHSAESFQSIRGISMLEDIGPEKSIKSDLEGLR